jgi:hypothetical protein
MSWCTCNLCMKLCLFYLVNYLCWLFALVPYFLGREKAQFSLVGTPDILHDGLNLMHLITDSSKSITLPTTTVKFC